MYLYEPSDQSATPTASLSDAVSVTDAATLKAVVRGERAVEDLKATRIWSNAHHAEEAINSATHPVCAADLAEGIVSLKDDPVALEELANAIVAISGLLSFQDEQSERLISCVWDLSLGVPLEIPTVWLANAIRDRARKPVAA